MAIAPLFSTAVRMAAPHALFLGQAAVSGATIVAGAAAFLGGAGVMGAAIGAVEKRIRGRQVRCRMLDGSVIKVWTPRSSPLQPAEILEHLVEFNDQMTQEGRGKRPN